MTQARKCGTLQHHEAENRDANAPRVLEEVVDERRIYPKAIRDAYSAGRPHWDEERPPSREADRERNRQAGSPASSMLADAPEQKKHAWPKCNRKKVDRVVET